jgi:hypothetical protein
MLWFLMMSFEFWRFYIIIYSCYCFSPQRKTQKKSIVNLETIAAVHANNKRGQPAGLSCLR